MTALPSTWSYMTLAEIQEAVESGELYGDNRIQYQVNKLIDYTSRGFDTSLTAVEDTNATGLYYEADSGLYVLKDTLTSYTSKAAALEAYYENAISAGTIEDTTDTTVEASTGFRNTILTGGEGLANSALPSLRRAGSLLAGLDRTNSYINA